MQSLVRNVAYKSLQSLCEWDERARVAMMRVSVDEMLVFGQYWDEHGSRTAVGDLVAHAKDDREADATLALARLVGEWATGLSLPADPIVTAVPPNPARPDHLAATLAAAVAVALEAPLVLDLLERRFPTPRLRDTAVAARPAMADAAGYVADPVAIGRNVVILDDVVLTGTTLGHLAQRLLDAGAESVTPLVAARTRIRARRSEAD